MPSTNARRAVTEALRRQAQASLLRARAQIMASAGITTPRELQPQAMPAGSVPKPPENSGNGERVQDPPTPEDAGPGNKAKFSRTPSPERRRVLDISRQDLCARAPLSR
jgi:hypothetical protein